MSRGGLARKARAAVRASARLAAVPAASYRKPATVTCISVKLIRLIVEAQDRICPVCDDWLEFDPDFGISHPLRPSIDHVVPRAKGGGNVGNKLVMHRECNCAKGDRMPTGCELIWLAGVNARLGLGPDLSSDNRSSR